MRPAAVAASPPGATAAPLALQLVTPFAEPEALVSPQISLLHSSPLTPQPALLEEEPAKPEAVEAVRENNALLSEGDVDGDEAATASGEPFSYAQALARSSQTRAVSEHKSLAKDVEAAPPHAAPPATPNAPITLTPVPLHLHAPAGAVHAHQYPGRAAVEPGSVFVRNLPASMDESAVIALFTPFGPVRHLTLKPQKNSPGEALALPHDRILLTTCFKQTVALRSLISSQSRLQTRPSRRS